MNKFLKTINGKITLIFACMILLGAVSVSISSSYAQRNYRNHILETEQKNLDLSAETMNTSLKLLEDLLMYMPYNSDGMKILEQIENHALLDAGEKWRAVTRINNQFNSITSVYDYVENIFTYYPNQNLFLNSKVNEDMSSVILEDIEIEQVQNSSGWSIIHLSSGWYMYKFYYLRKAYVGAWISCDDLMREFGMAQDNILLIDRQGNILSGEGESRNIELSSLFEQSHLDDPSVIMSSLPDAQMYLVNEPESLSLEYSGEPFLKNGYFSMIFLLNIFTLIIVMIGVLFWIHKPIKYLQAGITRIRRGDTQYRLEKKTGMSLEFTEICDEFNDMLEQLNKTKIQMYEQEIEKNQTKLRYLGQQIRPHFILNALNTVYNYSKKDTEVTRKIIRLLSAYYRYVVNVDSNYVPLGEELKHIENYLAFQKIRYEDALEYNIECPSALRVVPIPPFLMESFVGNSLKYGADEKDKIFITINVCQIGEFDLKIMISDKGRGFPPEILEAVRSFQATGTTEDILGVGIRNSIERIRLIYKTKAELKFYNDKGAVVEIIIHLQKNEEDFVKEHAEYILP